LSSPKDAYTLWANRLPCPPLDCSKNNACNVACLEGIQKGWFALLTIVPMVGLRGAGRNELLKFPSGERGAHINLAAADFPAEYCLESISREF
jgi:hypothetical protein